MVTSAAEDPIRAAVERWLHGIVAATIAAPVGLVGGAGRCVARRAAAVRDRLVQPARIARSLLDLVGQAAPSVVEPVSVGRRTLGDPLGPVPAAVATQSIDRRALPIDEYESLAASQVVARLPSLTTAELRAVRRFEADHRGRRTVLGKIDQLLAPT